MFGNNPFGLWWTTRRAIAGSPAETFANRSGVRLDVPPEFLEEVRCGEAYLIWFGGPTDYYPPEARERQVDVRRLASYPDGSRYRLTALLPATADC